MRFGAPNMRLLTQNRRQRLTDCQAASCRFLSFLACSLTPEECLGKDENEGTRRASVQRPLL
jgi:hypothetical protein